MSEEYKNGFDAGYKFCVDNWDANTGYYKMSLPNNFVHRQGAYNCGFGEGLISGRGAVIKKCFGTIKSICWDNGKAVIEK